MKKLILFYPVLILLLGFSYGKLIDDKAKSLLKQFQLTESHTKDIIFSNTSGPSFYFPNMKELKALAAGDRAAMVSTAGMYIKEFTASEEFRNKYNEYRESKKPTAPQKPMKMDELKEQQKQDMIKSIAELEKSKGQMPKDQQDMFNETIEMFKQQLKEMDNPDNPMYSSEIDSYNNSAYEQQLEYYNKQVSEWEKEYPVNNPKPMIKNWLQNFLDKTSTIDFNAQLKDVKGKKLFVNPDYEKKDYQWKLFFRAGKETIDAARKFSQNWLNELK